MYNITKKIIKDDKDHPIAVQIPYEEWLMIEDALQIKEPTDSSPDLMRYAGAIKIKEEPLIYQKRIREEWD